MVTSASSQSSRSSLCNQSVNGHAEHTDPLGSKSIPTTGGVLIIGGPDGAGKSTLAGKVIAEVLGDAPVMHIRFPRLLPRRNRDRARARRLGEGGTPDLFGPRVYPRTYPWGTSVWKSLYLFIDFLLGWRMRVAPFVRSGGWVVFSNCSPAYPDFCIPPPPPDRDCDDVNGDNFTVKPPDPHGFDSDGDGVGCES